LVLKANAELSVAPIKCVAEILELPVSDHPSRPVAICCRIIGNGIGVTISPNKSVTGNLDIGFIFKALCNDILSNKYLKQQAQPYQPAIIVLKYACHCAACLVVAPILI
jgi:hypothetical protein